MWYSSEKQQRPLATFEGDCPICGQKAKMLLTKEERSGCIWNIPYWGHDYYVTCGNCFATTKIDKNVGGQIEIQSKTQKEERE